MTSDLHAFIAFYLVLFFLFPPQVESGGIQGKVQTSPGIGLSSAVVYIDKIPGGRFAPPTEAVVINQVNLDFHPDILPVLVGTVVGFLNSDPLRHNVFSPSPSKRFNLGTYPPGVIKYVTFDTPGEVLVLCNVHHNMHAHVLVLETPFFSVTDRNGKYIISDLPKGSYTLVVWHAKFSLHKQTVALDQEQDVMLDFILKH